MDSPAIEHLSYPQTLEESPAESSTHSERPLLKDRLYVGNLHPSVDEYAPVLSYVFPSNKLQVLSAPSLLQVREGHQARLPVPQVWRAQG